MFFFQTCVAYFLCYSFVYYYLDDGCHAGAHPHRAAFAVGLKGLLTSAHQQGMVPGQLPLVLRVKDDPA